MGLQIKEILGVAEKILREAGIKESNVDAQLLLSYVIGYDNRRIFMNWAKEIDDDHSEHYFELIQRRAAGEPTQYLTNRQDFMGFPFYVDNRVLIPRMDTEILVESVLAYTKNHKSIQRVLDMCTGSGVIAVSIQKMNPSLKITASDIDENALDVARKNATIHKIDGKIKFINSDLFDEFNTGFGSKKFDLIVSNPPYIKSRDIPTLQKEIYDYEPMKALDGGDDGLVFYKRMVEEAPNFLKKGGALFFEIGYDQANALIALLNATNEYDNISIQKDLGGNDRVLFATLQKKK